MVMGQTPKLHYYEEHLVHLVWPDANQGVLRHHEQILKQSQKKQTKDKHTKVKTTYDNLKQHNAERDYVQNVYLFGGQLEGHMLKGQAQVLAGQTRLSELEETKQLAFELSHQVVVENDDDDYKPEVVLDKHPWRTTNHGNSNSTRNMNCIRCRRIGKRFTFKVKRRFIECDICRNKIVFKTRRKTCVSFF